MQTMNAVCAMVAGGEEGKHQLPRTWGFMRCSMNFMSSFRSSSEMTMPSNTRSGSLRVQQPQGGGGGGDDAPHA